MGDNLDFHKTTFCGYLFTALLEYEKKSLGNASVNSNCAHDPPPPRATPGH